MTAREPEPTPQKLEMLKIPMVLVMPIYGVLAGIATLGWTWSQSNTDMQARMSGIQRDMAAQVRTLTRVERKVETAYSSQDAQREFQRIDSTLSDHETRIRKIER